MLTSYPGMCSDCCTLDPCTLLTADTLTVVFSGITTCPGSTGSVGGSYTVTRVPGTAGFAYDSGSAVITNAFGAQYKLTINVGCSGFSLDGEGIGLHVDIALILIPSGGGFALADGDVKIPFDGGSGSWSGQDAFCSSGSPAQGVANVTVSTP